MTYQSDVPRPRSEVREPAHRIRHPHGHSPRSTGVLQHRERRDASPSSARAARAKSRHGHVALRLLGPIPVGGSRGGQVLLDGPRSGRPVGRALNASRP